MLLPAVRKRSFSSARNSCGLGTEYHSWGISDGQVYRTSFCMCGTGCCGWIVHGTDHGCRPQGQLRSRLWRGSLHHDRHHWVCRAGITRTAGRAGQFFFYRTQRPISKAARPTAPIAIRHQANGAKPRLPTKSSSDRTTSSAETKAAMKPTAISAPSSKLRAARFL